MESRAAPAPPRVSKIPPKPPRVCSKCNHVIPHCENGRCRRCNPDWRCKCGTFTRAAEKKCFACKSDRDVCEVK